MANEKATALVTRSADPSRIQRPGKAGNREQSDQHRFLSPYLCPWCRNGLSVNEAHENCLAAGKFDRFWPIEGVTVRDVRSLPMKDIAGRRMDPSERQVMAWFYLYLLVREHQNRVREDVL